MVIAFYGGKTLDEVPTETLQGLLRAGDLKPDFETCVLEEMSRRGRDTTMALCEAFKATIGVEVTAEQLHTFERELYVRGLNVAWRQHGPKPE